MQDASSANSPEALADSATCPSHGLGASFNPFGEEQMANPYPFFAQARRVEPIFFSSPLNAWVVTRYDDIRVILRDPRRFSSIGNLETIAAYTPEALAILGTSKALLANFTVNLDPPRHTHIRASLTRGFSTRQIASYEPLVRQLVHQLIDQFPREGQIDLIQAFTHPFPVLVICHLMGIPEGDFRQVLGWCDDWLELLYAKVPPERQVECARSAVAYTRYIQAFIEQRRASPRNDLISDLIKISTSGEASLSEEELLAQVVDLVLASDETTPALLSMCLLHVLHDHHYWQTIREQPEMIPNMLEETLRLNGSGIGAFRVTTEAIQLGEITLPKGALVLLAGNSANHDEVQFPDPEAFNPQRQNLSRHLGFGNGIHFCLGAPLARLEGRVALEVLSTRLPSLHLVPNQELNDWRRMPVHALRELRVEWDINEMPASE